MKKTVLLYAAAFVAVGIGLGIQELRIRKLRNQRDQARKDFVRSIMLNVKQTEMILKGVKKPDETLA